MSPNTVDAVLELVGRGWCPFPVEPGGKRPLKLVNGRRVPWRHLSPMTSADVLDAWSQYPDANVGIDCGRSELLVVDIDAASAWRRLLDEEEVDETPTLTVRTGKGRHLYYRSPGSLGNRGLALGIDIRGDGGYVVAPPSSHAQSDRRYEFEDSSVPAIDVPTWIVARLTSQSPSMQWPSCAPSTASAERILRRQLRCVEDARIGERNETLNRAAFTLGQLIGAEALDAERVIANLLRAAVDAGLSESEARATVKSGLTAGFASVRENNDE